MAAVLPYVWSDACRDRVFPSLLPFFHAHGADCPTSANSEGPLAVSPYAWSTSITHPCQIAWRTVLLHAHGAHREKFARPDSSTAVSPHTEPQQTQFAGLCRCITYNYLRLFKTIFCGLKIIKQFQQIASNQRHNLENCGHASRAEHGKGPLLYGIPTSART